MSRKEDAPSTKPRILLVNAGTMDLQSFHPQKTRNAEADSQKPLHPALRVQGLRIADSVLDFFRRASFTAEPSHSRAPKKPETARAQGRLWGLRVEGRGSWA